MILHFRISKLALMILALRLNLLTEILINNKSRFFESGF